MLWGWGMDWSLGTSWQVLSLAGVARAPELGYPGQSNLLPRCGQGPLGIWAEPSFLLLLGAQGLTWLCCITLWDRN